MKITQVWPDAEDSLGRPVCGVTACESCGRAVFCGLPIERRDPPSSLLYMPPHRCMDCPAAKAEGLRHIARRTQTIHLKERR